MNMNTDFHTNSSPFYNLLDFLPEALFIVNCENKIVSWNEAIEELTGVSREEIMKKGKYAHMLPFYGKPRPSLADYIINNEKEAAEQQYYNFTKKGEALHGEVFIDSFNEGKGAYFQLKASPFYSKTGEILGAIESITDITDFRRLEEDLKSRDTIFRQISKNTLDIFGTTDLESTIQYISDSFETIVGYSVENVLGKPVTSFAHPEDINKIKSVFSKAVAEKHSAKVEYRIKHVEGHYIDMETHGNIMLDENEKPMGVVFSARNITDRKEAEAKHEKAMNKLEKIAEGMIKALLETLEVRDPYTASHQKRVGRLAYSIAQKMELPKEKAEGIRLAALIHDIGKMKVPIEILSKPGKIDKSEFDIIKQHVEVGQKILKEIEFPWPIADIIAQHHERLDGSGYPNGFSGEEISIEGH